MARTSQHRGFSETLLERVSLHARDVVQPGRACSLLLIRPLEPAGSGYKLSPARRSDILRGLASPVQQLIRKTDIIEVDESSAIAVVLREADETIARTVFNRLRARVTPLQDANTPFRIVVGYATATWTPAGVCPVATMLDAAWRPRAILGAAHAAQHTGFAAEEHGEPDTDAVQRRQHLHIVTEAAPTEHDVLRDRARSFGVPYVTLPYRLPANCLGALPVSLARELQVVPIGRTRGMLTVAMRNPKDREAVVRLHTTTGLDIFPVLAAPDEIERGLMQLGRGRTAMHAQAE